MNRDTMITHYLQYGIRDYRLKTKEDLYNVHEVRVNNIKGYDLLNDTNKAIFERFIIKIYNNFGLDLRATLHPIGIYYVEDIPYTAKLKQDDTHYTLVGHKVNKIDSEGNKTLLHKKKMYYKEYKDFDIKPGNPQIYLRFEYRINDRKEWLHVVKNGEDWY